MTTVRERVRAELIGEIKAAARRQVAEQGANLSLRAIARELEMVSSAIYRYFPSRDDLLTALILDGYNALADVVTEADAQVARDQLTSRFRAVARAIRQWARAHRAEYALLFGSPVPGYSAPRETVVPVVRLTGVVLAILRDGVASGALTADERPLPAELQDDLGEVLAEVDPSAMPASVLARGLAAWSGLFGLISFELFGHLVGVTTHYDSYYDDQVARLSTLIGLPDS